MSQQRTIKAFRVRPDTEQLSHVKDGRRFRFDPVALSSHCGAFVLESGQNTRRLFSASALSGGFSITGTTAIFLGAFWPVMA